MDILVVLEDNHGSLHRMSKEAVAGAQKMGGTVTALAIGGNAEALAGELSDIDLTEVITVNHRLVSSYNADGYTEGYMQSGDIPIFIIYDVSANLSYEAEVSGASDLGFFNNTFFNKNFRINFFNI